MSARKRTKLSPREDDEESTRLVPPQAPPKTVEKKPLMEETLIEIPDTDSEEEIEEGGKPSFREKEKPEVEDEEDPEETKGECGDDPDDEKEEMPFMPSTSAEASDKE
ncbi:phosphatidylglycerol--prolipoprotein diacylglyceryl transferase-like [Sorex araneus]|uniref:phosphatidylglycerol--prolipoprotein diacylglyceryl transferase-like n=1 Tax=Sorex araneus TaxID=42254 RepID=UPI002434061F|nr:phosphatidylglycerol--prolipoprotein diacylglyceryl transferase-like [Sorex araneus]